MGNPCGLHVGPILVILGNTYRLYGPYVFGGGGANNKRADQPALLLSLISPFVVHFFVIYHN